MSSDGFPAVPYATLDKTTVSPDARFLRMPWGAVEDPHRPAELLVSIGADKVIEVVLHCCGVEARGKGDAAVRRFQDRTSFALGNVDITGYETAIGHCVTGRVSIGLTWSDRTETGVSVNGTALAEGSWHGGPIRFIATSEQTSEHRTNQDTFVFTRSITSKAPALQAVPAEPATLSFVKSGRGFRDLCGLGASPRPGLTAI